MTVAELGAKCAAVGATGLAGAPVLVAGHGRVVLATWAGLEDGRRALVLYVEQPSAEAVETVPPVPALEAGEALRLELATAGVE